MKLPDFPVNDPAFYIFATFCVISLVQLFYYLFFFCRLAFYKEAKRAASQTHAVSVIICARDEAANITKNLMGVLVQKYPSTHEIIVVDDNSLDETKYILEGLRKEFKKLNLIELKQEAKHIPGKKFPLSVGIKTAKYEIVLLTDADCVPASENWLEKMQSAFTPGIEIVLGYGPLHKRKDLLNKLIRWETFLTALQYFSYARAGFTYMGVGRNLSYKKSLFFKHKGFSSHNHIPGGDDDLFINKVANKKNVAIQIDPESFTISDAPKTWKGWKNQKKRHYTTSKYYNFSHKLLLFLYSFSLFLYYPFFLLSLLLFHWQYTVTVFLLRLLIQAIVMYKTTRKLDEKDLFPWFIVLDIWMFFYYLYFSASLFKKPAREWK